MEYFTKLGILDLDGPITDSNTCHGTEATAAGSLRGRSILMPFCAAAWANG